LLLLFLEFLPYSPFDLSWRNFSFLPKLSTKRKAARKQRDMHLKIGFIGEGAKTSRVVLFVCFKSLNVPQRRLGSMKPKVDLLPLKRGARSAQDLRA
jgi:hypothetical protein